MVNSINKFPLILKFCYFCFTLFFFMIIRNATSLKNWRYRHYISSVFCSLLIRWFLTIHTNEWKWTSWKLQNSNQIRTQISQPLLPNHWQIDNTFILTRNYNDVTQLKLEMEAKQLKFLLFFGLKSVKYLCILPLITSTGSKNNYMYASSISISLGLFTWHFIIINRDFHKIPSKFIGRRCLNNESLRRNLFRRNNLRNWYISSYGIS